MKEEEKKYELVKFEDGELEVEVSVSPKEETIWMTLDQISLLFGRDKSVISRHIKNVFLSDELDEKSTVAKNATVQMEGNREIKRYIEYYNLDIIIAVGYRVNSKRGTLFRIWANKVLKDYLLKGYAINENRVVVTNENYIELRNEVASINNRLEKIEEKVVPIEEEIIEISLEEVDEKILTIDDFLDDFEI